MATTRQTVIATRRLSLRVGTKEKKIVVKIGVPKRLRSGLWACPFWISGLKHRTRYEMTGIDAVHALVLTLEAIRLKLKPLGDRISLPGYGQIESGDFPQYVPNLFGSDITRRIEKFIKRELLRGARREKARYEKRRSRGKAPSRSTRNVA